jgi:hypothetical protein
MNRFSNLVEGVTQVVEPLAKPLLPVAAIAAPGPTIAGLLAGTAGYFGGEVGGRLLTDDPTIPRFMGNVLGTVGGVVGGLRGKKGRFTELTDYLLEKIPSVRRAKEMQLRLNDIVRQGEIEKEMAAKKVADRVLKSRALEETYNAKMIEADKMADTRRANALEQQHKDYLVAKRVEEEGITGQGVPARPTYQDKMIEADKMADVKRAADLKQQYNDYLVAERLENEEAAALARQEAAIRRETARQQAAEASEAAKPTLYQTKMLKIEKAADIKRAASLKQQAHDELVAERLELERLALAKKAADAEAKQSAVTVTVKPGKKAGKGKGKTNGTQAKLDNLFDKVVRGATK